MFRVVCPKGIKFIAIFYTSRNVRPGKKQRRRRQQKFVQWLFKWNAWDNIEYDCNDVIDLNKYVTLPWRWQHSSIKKIERILSRCQSDIFPPNRKKILIIKEVGESSFEIFGRHFSFYSTMFICICLLIIGLLVKCALNVALFFCIVHAHLNW